MLGKEEEEEVREGSDDYNDQLVLQLVGVCLCVCVCIENGESNVLS